MRGVLNMYGNYINNPFIMPNIPYGSINAPIRMGMQNIPNRVGLGSSLKSLLGLGTTRNASLTKGINWSSLLNNTSKTIGVVKEAIPIVKEVKPMFNNMRSIVKVASIFKDETDANLTNNPTTTTNNSTNSTTTSTNNINTSNQNKPNFFL